MKYKVSQTLVGEPFLTKSREVKKLLLDFNGVRFDRHYGQTSFADIRTPHASKRSEILNLRQITIVSEEELNLIATQLKIDEVKAEDLSANLVTSGLRNLTQLRFGTLLKFEGGCMIMTTGENQPCQGPAENIAETEKEERIEKEFLKNALKLRGLTGIVFKAGVIKPEMEFEVITPKVIRD